MGLPLYLYTLPLQKNAIFLALVSILGLYDRAYGASTG